MSEERLVTCGECKGTGEIRIGHLVYDEDWTSVLTCPTCKGRGLVPKVVTDEQETPAPGTIEPVKKHGFYGSAAESTWPFSRENYEKLRRWWYAEYEKAVGK